jgi:hypothetical protein
MSPSVGIESPSPITRILGSRNKRRAITYLIQGDSLDMSRPPPMSKAANRSIGNEGLKKGDILANSAAFRG